MANYPFDSEKPPRVIFSEMVAQHLASVGRTPQIDPAEQLRKARLDFEAEVAIARREREMERQKAEAKQAAIREFSFSLGFPAEWNGFKYADPKESIYIYKSPGNGQERADEKEAPTTAAAALAGPLKRLIEI
jgi:hypothetical protein